MIILNDTFALDGNQFSYQRKEGLLVAEASDVGYQRSFRIYDDACDVGIAIQGKRYLIRFYMEDVDTDNEGDLMGWKFTIISEDERKHPELKGLRVLIIND
jgi:hypothetical protein